MRILILCGGCGAVQGLKATGHNVDWGGMVLPLHQGTRARRWSWTCSTANTNILWWP
ncbi:hypothetical protein PF002_g15793 [Phytophthora fragariae]|uniref:Uncharacterized protein n=1 Tax=Phytophthora fragariae TaxID=53985 RepID=A0A6A3YNN9_9STRA|nr:hypothetical protein PF002_g15793 [Phytophthora fragariae]